MTEGLRIIDHLSLLSKNQMLRLKTNIKPLLSEKIFSSIDAKLKFNKIMRNEILPSIYYDNECQLRYNHFEFYMDEKIFVLELLFQEKIDTKEKLRQFVREKQIHRKSSKADDKTDVWKTYVQLKTISKRTDIPTPQDISKNSSTYEELVKNIPNSPLKTYIEKCLTIHDS